MKEEKLKKMIRAMYLLRESLKQKQDDDIVFKFKSKTKVIAEVEEIIDQRLEEFYSTRYN